MEMGADRPCRVSRGKMRALCGEGVEVRYGKKFLHAREVEVDGGKRVEVEFEDGEKVLGDVVIGCDGARSRVRSVLVGEKEAELADAGVGMFNFPYQFDGVLAERIRGMNELFITSIHPDHGNMFWLSSTYQLPITSKRAILATFIRSSTDNCSQSKTSPNPPPPTPQHGPSKFSSPSLYPAFPLTPTSPPKKDACPSSNHAAQHTPSPGAQHARRSIRLHTSRSTKPRTGPTPNHGTITTARSRCVATRRTQ